MAPLSTELRTQLGNAIKTARREAEAGAHKALQSLAVGSHEPHSSMTPEDRKLRNRLRAHGRQLGDVRDRARGTQSIDRLAHEVAYEHWHRMLFARYLAENDLLIEPESGVTITMEECEELARDEGVDSRALAARFAQASLPQIFRSDDPVLEVELAPEVRQALDKLLESLPNAVFIADDSLGWTYQYWQAEKKEAVNESGDKIGADELPAVTQLFTEHYMVLFLYHNTIGAWHAGKVLAANPSLAETAQSEDELREAVRLRSEGGYDFEYLRFARESREGDEEDARTGPWRPAAGIFEAWPKAANELKVLDPCCGSGHFLVEGFNLIVRLRMDDEELALEDAIRAVLADNLYGLELDLRCTQIAAFNLAMAAWKLAGKPIGFPPLHVACSGLAVGSTTSEWTNLGGENERLRTGMARLYDLFEQAPELGSLIDPKNLRGDLLAADFSDLETMLAQALDREPEDVDENERAVAAHGMAKAAELLIQDYTLVITNVPYLGNYKQSDKLAALLQESVPRSAGNLAAAFVLRTVRLLSPGGTVALVTPQEWLLLGRYRKLREWLIEHTLCRALAFLGSGGFETIGGAVVTTALSAFSKPHSQDSEGCELAGFDVQGFSTPQRKAAALAKSTVRPKRQADWKQNPGCRITVEELGAEQYLSSVARSWQGLKTSDDDSFVFAFWEVNATDSAWLPLLRSMDSNDGYSGRQHLLRWDDGNGSLRRLNAAQQRDRKRDLQGRRAWGTNGVAINTAGRVVAGPYLGEAFASEVVVLTAEPNNLASILAYARSSDFEDAIRRLDKRVSVTTSTFQEVPFDSNYWQSHASSEESWESPISHDPTQWIFHGHPAAARSDSVLQVAVSRLLGFRWPPEIDATMHLDAAAREWVSKCDELSDFADEDGIVCLSATRGERAASDRMRELLAEAFGESWSNAKEVELLSGAGGGKKAAASLETWLRDRFFEEHCKLFHQRPFIWHIWDGNKDGFHCLVNVHRLTGPAGEGRRTLQAITFSYLKDWIDRQRADQQRGREGADSRLAAAQDLQGQLEKILEGEPPYDVFVRWKPLHEQAIGWEPDINDGARLNIRPFMKAELRKGGKKGAGILRWKPNIKWAKDRGKEPLSLRPKESFPWFWTCAGEGIEEERTNFAGGADFDGNRWNDLHYTNEIKKAARHSSGEGSAE